MRRIGIVILVGLIGTLPVRAQDEKPVVTAEQFESLKKDLATVKTDLLATKKESAEVKRQAQQLTTVVTSIKSVDQDRKRARRKVHEAVCEAEGRRFHKLTIVDNTISVECR